MKKKEREREREEEEEKKYLVVKSLTGADRMLERALSAGLMAWETRWCTKVPSHKTLNGCLNPKHAV